MQEGVLGRRKMDDWRYGLILIVIALSYLANKSYLYLDSNSLMGVGNPSGFVSDFHSSFSCLGDRDSSQNLQQPSN